VANTGFEFRHGTEVVAKLTDLAAKDPSVSAVIGISQSRAESVEALGKLPTDLAVIGANTTGHFMLTELPRYFATQPTDANLATAMVADAASRGFTKAMVIADDHDGYSRELHSYLGTELARRKLTIVPQPFEFRSGDAYLDQVTSQLPDLAAKLCALARTHGAVFYTARGDYLPKLLAQVQLAACAVPVPMIAGDISHLVEYEGTPEYARVNKFTGVVFDYIAFSEHSDAEQATGSDALRAAAAAIGQAAMVTGADSVRASNVLQRLIGGLVVSGERRFTIDAGTRAPKNRPTMFLCRPKPTGVGSGECHRPPIVPIVPVTPVRSVPSPP
jgi:ABC-type branched-subunit amino acid transport system substrate-binding protein